MEKNKQKQERPKEQVHSEFETSVGNDFNVVREETPVKKKEDDRDGALNELPADEETVKNENTGVDEPPKMDAKEHKND